LENQKVPDLLQASWKQLNQVSDLVEHSQQGEHLKCRKDHNQEINHDHREVLRMTICSILIATIYWNVGFIWADTPHNKLNGGWDDVERIYDVPSVITIRMTTSVELFSLYVDEES
jgi:hypothetical protein